MITDFSYGCATCDHLRVVGKMKQEQRVCMPICGKRKPERYIKDYKGIDCELYKPGQRAIPADCKVLRGGKAFCDNCVFKRGE